MSAKFLLLAFSITLTSKGHCQKVEIDSLIKAIQVHYVDSFFSEDNFDSLYIFFDNKTLKSEDIQYYKALIDEEGLSMPVEFYYSTEKRNDFNKNIVVLDENSVRTNKFLSIIPLFYSKNKAISYYLVTHECGEDCYVEYLYKTPIKGGKVEVVELGGE